MALRHILFAGEVDPTLVEIIGRLRRNQIPVECLFGKTAREMIGNCTATNERSIIALIVIAGEFLAKQMNQEAPNTIDIIPELRLSAPGVTIITSSTNEVYNHQLLKTGCCGIVRRGNLENYLRRLLTEDTEPPLDVYPVSNMAVSSGDYAI